MTDAEISARLEQLFEGTLTEADAAELKQWLDSNPEHLNEAAEQFALHQLLDARGSDNGQFIDQIQSSIRHSQNSASNIRRLESAVMKRVKLPAGRTVRPGAKARRKPARQPSFNFLAAATVALVLSGGAIAIWFSGNRAPAVVVSALNGNVQIVQNSSALASVGSSVPEGAIIRCGEGASATISFADGTAIKLEETTDATFSQSGSKQVELLKGAVEADVRPQRQDAPLILLTGNATATVLGTRLRLSFSTTESTKLDVLTGKVKLERNSDKSSVLVSGGFTAVAKADQPLVATPLPPVHDGKQPLVLEVESFGNGAAAQLAKGPTRAIFRERPPNGGPPRGGWALAVPGKGTEITDTVSLRPGRYYLWVRWRDETFGTISFDVLADGQLLGSVKGKCDTNDWKWTQFSFESRGESRITLRSTYEGLPVTQELLYSKQYWGPQHPYEAVNRWDQLQISNDPQYRPE